MTRMFRCGGHCQALEFEAGSKSLSTASAYTSRPGTAPGLDPNNQDRAKSISIYGKGIR